MVSRSSILALVAHLVLCSRSAEGTVTQVAVDVEPYAGVYVPTGSITSDLRQHASLTLGTRLSVWVFGRVGIEGTVNYAPSHVSWTQGIQPSSNYSPSTAAHLTAVTARAIVSLTAPAAATALHVGGGIGSVGYGGAAYCCDTYLQTNGTTFLTGVVNAGAVFRLNPQLALRVDADNYLYHTRFQCRSGGGGPVACYFLGGGPHSAGQMDVVMSLGLELRLSRH